MQPNFTERSDVKLVQIEDKTKKNSFFVEKQPNLTARKDVKLRKKTSAKQKPGIITFYYSLWQMIIKCHLKRLRFEVNYSLNECKFKSGLTILPRNPSILGLVFEILCRSFVRQR